VAALPWGLVQDIFPSALVWDATKLL
jgi:hypothetical protein